MASDLLPGWVIWCCGNGGRFPFANRILSLTVARPNDGEWWRFDDPCVAPIGSGGLSGTFGTRGSEGMGGIWLGRFPDSARKESAFIHSRWRSAETAVNLRARAGVRMRMERS